MRAARGPSPPEARPRLRPVPARAGNRTAAGVSSAARHAGKRQNHGFLMQKARNGDRSIRHAVTPERGVGGGMLGHSETPRGARDPRALLRQPLMCASSRRSGRGGATRKKSADPISDCK